MTGMAAAARRFTFRQVPTTRRMDSSAFCSLFSPFPSRVRWLWSWPRWCCWLGGGRARTAGAQLPREDSVLSGLAVSGVSSKASRLQLMPRWDGARSHDSDLPVLRHGSVQAVQEPCELSVSTRCGRVESRASLAATDRVLDSHSAPAIHIRPTPPRPPSPFRARTTSPSRGTSLSRW
jgi:hypothetical protein